MYIACCCRLRPTTPNLVKSAQPLISSLDVVCRASISSGTHTLPDFSLFIAAIPLGPVKPPPRHFLPHVCFPSPSRSFALLLAHSRSFSLILGLSLSFSLLLAPSSFPSLTPLLSRHFLPPSLSPSSKSVFGCGFNSSEGEAIQPTSPLLTS